MAAALTDNNDLTLTATAFARHTGLTTTDQTTANVWLCNKGDLRDAVAIYQTGDHGHRVFAQRPVDDATVGVAPRLVVGDVTPFGTKRIPDGQTALTIGRRLARYPQSQADSATAAFLDNRLASNNQLGLQKVGGYTAPDTGSQCPCYRFREQYYVQHTNRDGLTTWFRCDPVIVQRTPDTNDLKITNVLFAAPLANRNNFRSCTQGNIAGDELWIGQFTLGKFLQATVLPELIKSASFGLTTPLDKIVFPHPKLTTLAVDLPRGPEHYRVR